METHTNLKPWQPGQSGNPNGRPVGSRSAFSAGFTRDLAEVWTETFYLSGFGSLLCRRCNSHRVRTFGRSKRGGYKCSRTEIQKSAYAEEETGDET
jgi:hypothetical protein